ncbi:hypothetical protein POJ06DRAFT_254210 [Lipomyces tetrasporus]|uniref:Peroxin 20 n=1 Tax=Lipomyces tetrasporus TaxID=54092 RepID=A0AAD7VRX4_9ASCO|nr:uncharacterized protein POJ06DRAFT_254210 [Lipomyces tetrasporus]KAJ8099683.1 hypothetical protein POJ06DRAFT_254210 [Lipomyces tetrasporus]
MDAACGPSTPLRAFHKHATSDRSLQQDRLVSQSSSSATQAGPSSSGAAFRTSSQQEGSLDGGYAAFLDSHIADGMAGASAEWISGDFASMKISEPQSQQHIFDKMMHSQEQSHYTFQPQQRHQQATSSSSTASWHQDFMQFLDGPASIPSAAVPQEDMRFGGYAPVMAHQTIAYAQQNVPMHEQVVSTGLRRMAESAEQDAAFKEEFDRVQEALSRQDEAERTNEDVDQQENDDGLAAIAGELLESLGSNRTQKFKDSTFLALMRRLRDKEVVVQGNKMVEAVSNDEYAESLGSGTGVMSSSFDTAQQELGVEGKFRTGAWEESF